MNRVAVYAGSFDPVTKGHEDVVRRAVEVFDEVHVMVGDNSAKSGTFSVKKRIALISESMAEFISATSVDDGSGGPPRPRVTVGSFKGLLASYAVKVGACAIVRGVRMVTDFEYELQLAHANAGIAPEVDTVFFPTRLGMGAISSSTVREIARHGGPVSNYVSPSVEKALRSTFAGD